MFKRLLLSGLTLLIIGLNPAFAAALPLSTAIDLAIKNNPEIQAVRHDWEAAKAKVPSSFWLPDPKLGADFERIPAGSSDLRQAEMRFYNFSQALPWPGMVWSEGQAAAARADMAGYQLESRRREVVRKLKTAYFNLARLDAEIKIAEDNVKLLRQGYKSALASYAAGRASQVETLKIQIDLARAENELLNLKDERAVKNLELNLVLNTTSAETYIVGSLPELSAEKPKFTIEAAPRLKMEESALNEARAMVGVAISTYLPETMAKVRNQKVGTSVGANDLMLEFSIPLWFPLRQNFQLAAANNNVEAKTASLQGMKNMLRLELQDLSTALEIERRKLNLFNTRLVPAARSAAEGSLAGYKSGKIDFLVLLDSLRGYLEIRREQVMAQAECQIKLAQLEEIGNEM